MTGTRYSLEVQPVIPARLARLTELANDLLYSWDIGSLPLTGPEKATSLALHYLPEAPIWPQLPQRSFREHFCAQYSEGFPAVMIDHTHERIWFDTSHDLSADLERFYERYLAKDLEYFRISEEYAAGFYAFVGVLKKNGLPPRARFLKGHCTVPLTFGITVKDQAGKDIAYNDMLFDAITKGLAMKAAGQVRVLNQFGLPVIIFIRRSGHVCAQFWTVLALSRTLLRNNWHSPARQLE